MDVEVARQRLQQRLAELTASARTLRAEHAGESGEISHVDQHQADYGTDLSDYEREQAVIGVVDEERAAVQAALRRCDEGTYGVCEVCGQPIPDERLEARPEATRCLADQARLGGVR